VVAMTFRLVLKAFPTRGDDDSQIRRCIRHQTSTAKGPLRLRATSRDVARRRSAERQKSRSNRTRLDFSGIDAAQLSGVARRCAQSECCRSYQCVRFQRRRAAPRDIARRRAQCERGFKSAAATGIATARGANAVLSNGPLGPGPGPQPQGGPKLWVIIFSID
jgi:hypothetical protein